MGQITFEITVRTPSIQIQLVLVYVEESETERRNHCCKAKEGPVREVAKIMRQIQRVEEGRVSGRLRRPAWVSYKGTQAWGRGHQMWQNGGSHQAGAASLWGRGQQRRAWGLVEGC